MGEILSKHSDQISATVGALIGSVICPGAGTIIGGLSGGSISMIINAAKGNDGGGFSVSYNFNRGVSVGYYNEVKDFVSKIDEGNNKAHNYHMISSIKNIDYFQKEENSQLEEKENVNTDLKVLALINTALGGAGEGIEQTKGVKNKKFFSKAGKGLKITSGIISFILSGKNIYDGYKKDGEKIGDNTKITVCKEIGSNLGAAAGAVTGAKLGAVAGPVGSITLSVVFAVSFSLFGNEAGKEGGKKLIEKGKNKKEDEKNKSNQDNKNP